VRVRPEVLWPTLLCATCFAVFSLTATALLQGQVLGRWLGNLCGLFGSAYLICEIYGSWLRSKLGQIPPILMLFCFAMMLVLYSINNRKARMWFRFAAGLRAEHKAHQARWN
jgi:hypothetical protein